MSSNETRIVREVLATLVAEAPPPIDFESLTLTRVVPEPVRPRRSPLVAVVAGFVLIVVTLGGLFVATQRGAPDVAPANPLSDATVFMMPGFVPDSLVLVRAEVSTSGNLTHQLYHQEGLAFSEVADRLAGQDIVEIYVSFVNDEEPLMDLSEYAAILEENTLSAAFAAVEELLIGGKKALVIEGAELVIDQTGEAYEARDDTTIVLILDRQEDGQEIAIQVMSVHLSRADTIAIAESLTPTSPDAFDLTDAFDQDRP